MKQGWFSVWSHFYLWNQFLLLAFTNQSWVFTWCRYAVFCQSLSVIFLKMQLFKIYICVHGGRFTTPTECLTLEGLRILLQSMEKIKMKEPVNIIFFNHTRSSWEPYTNSIPGLLKLDRFLLYLLWRLVFCEVYHCFQWAQLPGAPLQSLEEPAEGPQHQRSRVEMALQIIERILYLDTFWFSFPSSLAKTAPLPASIWSFSGLFWV